MRRLVESITGRLLSALAVALACLPRLPAYWLGAKLGDLAYLCLARRRSIALDNLEIAFGAEEIGRRAPCHRSCHVSQSR